MGLRKEIKKIVLHHKIHIIYICLLFLLVLFFFNKAIINIDKSPMCDLVLGYYPRAEILKESIVEYKDLFPLWNPYMMSGTPFFAKADVQWFVGLLGFFVLLVPNTFAAVKITFILTMLLAGISMYVLVYYLLKSEHAAFVAALVYTFNGWIISRFSMCHLSTTGGYLFLPLAILFTIMAFKTKKWLLFSIIGGILIALQIWMGQDLKVTLWTFPIIAIYLLIGVIGKNYSSRAIKAILILLVILSVTFGLTAIKVLPSKEYLDMSSKANIPLEQAMQRQIEFKDLFTKLIEPGIPKFHASGGFKIGIIAFLLACFAIFKRWKNKNVLYFLSVALFSILLATGTFVFKLVRLIPPYDSFRYLSRTLVIFEFAGAVLAGYGLYYLIIYLKNKKWNIKKIRLTCFLIIAAIILNLMVFGGNPYRDYPFRSPDEMTSNTAILQYLSKQPGNFRFHIYETRGIDWGTEYSSVPLGLKTIYGYDSAWLVEYMNEYLSIANQFPAKFWGNLNVKYLTSQTQLNLTGFEYVQEFEPCEICYPEIKYLHKVWGPYLYENKMFMPKAYMTENAILVVGEKESAKQMMYAIMTSSEYDPKKAVVVLGKESIASYKSEELKRYSMILLAKDSVDQSSAYKLQDFVDNGGVLLPDLTKGKNQISNEDVNEALSGLNESFFPVSDDNIDMITFDEIKVKLDDKNEGFLVYSETFSLYPGWRVKTGNEILRANGVISAVYVDGDEEIYFSYLPKSFVNGLIITLITLILLLVYFGYLTREIIKNKEKLKDKLKGIFPDKIFKHGENFGKYLMIGITWTIFTIVLLWLFIDMLGFSTLIGSSIVTALLFFGKYYAYRLIKLMKKGFMKYAATAIVFSLLIPAFMWLFVDVIGMSTIIASFIVVNGLFVFRFVAFYKLGLISTDESVSEKLQKEEEKPAVPVAAEPVPEPIDAESKENTESMQEKEEDIDKKGNISSE